VTVEERATNEVVETFRVQGKKAAQQAVNSRTNDDHFAWATNEAFMKLVDDAFVTLSEKDGRW